MQVVKEIETIKHSTMLSNRNYHVMVVHHESGDLYLKVIEFSEKRSKEFFDTFEGMLRARMHIIQRLYGKETVWELTEQEMRVLIKQKPDGSKVYHIFRNFVTGRSLAELVSLHSFQDRGILVYENLERNTINLLGLFLNMGGFDNLLLTEQNVLFSRSGEKLKGNFTSFIGMETILMDEKISIKDFEEIRHYLDPNIFMEPKQYRINGKVKIRNFCVLLLSMIIKRKIKSEQQTTSSKMGVNLLSVEEVKEIIKKDNIPSILKTTYVKDCLKKAEDHTGRKYSQLFDKVFESSEQLTWRDVIVSLTDFQVTPTPLQGLKPQQLNALLVKILQYAPNKNKLSEGALMWQKLIAAYIPIWKEESEEQKARYFRNRMYCPEIYLACKLGIPFQLLLQCQTFLQFFSISQCLSIKRVQRQILTRFIDALNSVLQLSFSLSKEIQKSDMSTYDQSFGGDWMMLIKVHREEVSGLLNRILKQISVQKTININFPYRQIIFPKEGELLGKITLNTPHININQPAKPQKVIEIVPKDQKAVSPAKNVTIQQLSNASDKLQTIPNLNDMSLTPSIPQDAKISNQKSPINGLQNKILPHF